ncbi:MAG: CotH kinase family protein, partial [Planctomycetota bacterium]
NPEPGGCIAVDVERPAWFWMKGEDANKIRVEVRRKKGFAFPNETSPEKVALKIDINQYYCDPYTEDCNLDPFYDPNAAPDWHGLKKLSLEVNIDSIDTIAETVAVNIHRMASATEGYGWPVWYANWCKLYVNGTYIGVYTFVEQYDKQYMIHRDIYEAHGHSWLYKHHDCDGRFVLKIGDDTYPKSQGVEALCYAPFYSAVAETQSTGGECSVPDDANIIADMNQWVDMSRMLSTAAIDAFLANSDPLFWSNNNTYFYDPNIDEPNLVDKKRLYLPWDVDASFKSTATDIYYNGGSSGWDDLILDIPQFRSQYNQIMRDLLAGPLAFQDVNDFLDMVEPIITDAVEADSQVMSHFLSRYGATSAAEVFDWLRDWFSNRITNIRNQVDWDEPLMPPGIVLLNDDFNNATWDANWTISGAWVEATSTYAHASPSAKAPQKASGTFTCVDLDTSDAETVHVDFWLQKDVTDTPEEEIILYYYNGASYVNVSDLDTIGEDDEWLYYTDTITDSNYFVSNFKIRFDAALENGENVYVDEVVVTKELPQLAPLISGTILDPGAAAVAGVSVDANGLGGSDISDVNGYYEVNVPSGWSGTVTPTKTDYTFAPTERIYGSVTSNQSAQDYTGTDICDLYADGLFDLRDVDVISENWLTVGPDGDINDSGHVDLGDFAILADKF